MREYLSLLVDGDEFIDNGSPSVLRNPRTGELLQLDRFYPPNVGLEFNGPQHDRATEKFTDEQSLRQRERDLIKIGLCVTHGISLIHVRPEDMTFQTMRQKLEGLLPLKETSEHDLLIDFLEQEGERYRMGNLLEEARQSATWLPGAPLIVLTGPKGRSAGEQRSLQESGHFVQWDDPDAVIQAVKDVLEDQVSRPASSHP